MLKHVENAPKNAAEWPDNTQHQKCNKTKVEPLFLIIDSRLIPRDLLVYFKVFVKLDKGSSSKFKDFSPLDITRLVIFPIVPLT